MKVHSENSYSIIPQPQIITPVEGEFVLNEHTRIIYSGGDTDIEKLIVQFQTQIKLVLGKELKKSKTIKKRDVSSIIFNQMKELSFSKEAYRLSVKEHEVTISASSGAGFFYAIQTLYQLMPIEVYGKTVSESTKWVIPCVTIEDKPRFQYRGLHLDVCRHFVSVEDVKKFIDAMAIHKFNVFHWHLTDDQGWRLEIKKYPKLTTVGSSRKETLIGHSHQNFPHIYDGKPYSGYYTQEDAREVVRYAQERFITVIPEIEMPGHAQAAIASYPFLSCTQDSSIEVATRWGVFKEVFCPREQTFEFLENVLSEVLEIFPSEYIHIGGDECPKDRWMACLDCQNRIKSLNLKDESELQSYFIKRIERYLNSKGRQIIGWDEILEGGVAPNATVMSWRGDKGGVEAVKSRHKVIMTPMSHCYFDFYQFDQVHEPLTIGGLVDLKKVYEYNPVPSSLKDEEKEYILGAQANIWAEYILSYPHVEHMAYPRASALSEVLWSSEKKDWESFRKKMIIQYERYAKLNINASDYFNDVIFKSRINDNGELEISMETYNPLLEIHYTTNGEQPNMKNSEVYNGSLKPLKTTTYIASTFLNGKKIGKNIDKKFIVSKATGKKYTPETNKFLYRGGSEFALTNGVIGSERVSVNHWVGFNKGKDVEIIIDLESEQTIYKVEIGQLHNPNRCIYISPKTEIYLSQNGDDYFFAASNIQTITPLGAWKVYNQEIVFPKTSARYVKICFQHAGFCERDRPSGEIPSLMLIDEISIW